MESDKKSKMVYVIQDEDGYYPVNCAFTDICAEGAYTAITGIGTGFIYFSNENTCKKALARLQLLNDEYNFGKTFIIKHIDLKSVKEGNLVFKTLHIKEY